MTRNDSSEQTSAAIGALATGGLIGWLYLANALWGVPFVPFEISDLIIRLTPGAIATAGIEALGLWAQRILKGIGLLLVVGAGAGLAAWVARDLTGCRKPVRSALLPGGAALLATASIELALGRGPALIGSSGVILAASLLAWAWVVVWGVDRAATPSLRGAAAVARHDLTSQEIASEQTPLLAMTSRRRFLAQFGAAALTVAAGGYVLGQRLRPRPQRVALPPPSPTVTPATPVLSTEIASAPVPVLATPAPTASQPALLATPAIPTPSPDTPLPAFIPTPGTRPNITPLADFFVVDIAASDPLAEPATWRLQIKGLVDTPLALTFDELLAYPRVDVHGTLQCISNEVGGDLIGTTLFSGLHLRDLLAKARPQGGVEEVIFRSLDGYSESIPWDKALREDTLLVYGMNGATLTQEHGYPLRLFNPNHFGMKNPKWLSEIELVSAAYTGYWERRGWDKEAIVKTTAVTDASQRAGDGALQLGGIAFAGWRGIQEVGVSIDGGEIRPAVLDRPLSPFTWVRWRYDWPNPPPGSHTVVVRAIDGSGEEQTPFVMGPHPEGASGWHRIRVSV